tara:strand:+ start:793 stop:1350 length:558 start_codon:yes stop_codon:yes gene_type:complete
LSTNYSFSAETSSRYALALFELSSENNEIIDIEQEVTNLNRIYNYDANLRSFLKNPTKSISKQMETIRILSKILKFKKTLTNFLLLLVSKRRIFFLEKIMKSFLSLALKKRGELQASLVSSKKLQENELKEISKKLSEIIGSKLNFKFIHDDQLIGGIKLQVGSLMIDSSIQNKLRKFKKALLEI